MMQALVFAVGAAAMAANGTLSFLTIGDWGGASDDQPTTEAEIDNNAGMGAVAQQLGDVSFVMAMGDNFYSHGISGDSHSARFTQTFEDVFTHSALQLPWYVIAGNHDHLGNVSAQIAYTQECPSQRWQFPASHYTFNRTFTGASGKPVTVQVIYFDSVLFAGMSYHDEETGEFVAATGPEDEALMATQLEWLEAQLKASTADYLFVSAHYPVYSHCQHGPTESLKLLVLPHLRKYNATGFLAGHDHCLGHYVAHDLVFSVSGAGKSCCYSPKHVKSIPKDSMRFHMDADQTYGAKGGFASVTLSESSGHIAYYDEAGKVLYTSDTFAPRRV
eukprot:TRINITY_DN90_c0_g2_i1.p1 TRINITY_DN90_c0_g2~~TRINITY_DN90_c0_g2_i1.p1  ORF type:complete len:332 (+),score=110.36 TRINITY_DN90_c0_g2_i1:60-1055(+)